MVGSAIVRKLLQSGMSPESLVLKTHAELELDLTNQSAVQAFFAAEKPTRVYSAAAKVGGIHANNTYPADFIHQNLMMQANVIHAAIRTACKSRCSWAPAASTRAWPRSRYVKTHRNILPNLDFIPTGALPSAPHLLLMHGNLKQLVSAEYDLVLLDTPPVLADTAAFVRN